VVSMMDEFDNLIANSDINILVKDL
jgi:hypothetical protein